VVSHLPKSQPHVTNDSRQFDGW